MREAANPWEALRSDVGGVAWPPLANGAAAAVLALTQQLEAIERLPAAEIAAGQHRQLAALAGYAAVHSPYVGDILQTAGLEPAALADPAQLRKLPILSRRTLLTRKTAIDCRSVPPDHAPCTETGTSGSTGEPVYVTRTQITARFWLAHTMRDHVWHRRDFSGTLAVIRGNLAPGVASDQPDWGMPASLFFNTGRLSLLPINLDVAEQARRLRVVDPAYLLTYPNNLAALLDRFEADGGMPPNLRQVRTIGETVSPALRARCPVPITDVYSSQEVGIIGVQCPDAAGYHVMAESLIVEVVDAAGAPCAPGEIGRVLITDLTNLATPLLRYDIGDFAEAGTPCACGRGLPTVRRIIGRERNMLAIGDSRGWPLLRDALFHKAAPVLQYQVIQKTLDHIEMRLVCSRPPTAREEAALRATLVASLGHPFMVDFVYFADHLPRSASGKREDFISEVSGG